MNLLATRPRMRLPLLLSAALLLFLTGLPWLSRPGIQHDEALFAAVIYQPIGVAGVLDVSHHSIPLMVMTYVGCLKAWIYMAIFAVFRPTAVSIRLPVLIVCSLSVWLFGLLTNRLAGPRAALIAAFLLASDSLFLITGTLDWGPVAFQHLFLVGGTLALLTGVQEDRPKLIGLAGACFGLGLWDKALFLWMGAGLAAGLVCVYPREMLRALTLRNVLPALIGLLLGAAPLIGYNASHYMATVRGNDGFSTEEWRQKVAVVEQTLNESALFGWLGNETPGLSQPAYTGPFDRFSMALDAQLGHPKRNRMTLALLLVLPLTLIGSSSAYKRLFFCALLMASVAWLLMAITKDAGGSVHHTILLWPLPPFLLAIGLGRMVETPGRLKGALVIAVTCAIALTNLAITNSYYAAVSRNGGAINWTDANFRLVEYLEKAKQAQPIFIDWGMYNAVRLLGAGDIAIDQLNVGPAGEELDATTRSELTRVLAGKEVILIGHTPQYRFFPGIDARVTKYSAERNLERQEVAILPDGFGRPTISIFRLIPKAIASR